MKKVILSFLLLGLQSCSTNAQINASDKNKTRDSVMNFSFLDILDLDPNRIIIKDSFNFYFNNHSDLVESQDGNIYFCGLQESNKLYSFEYYMFTQDTSMLMQRCLNNEDGSYEIVFLKNQLIETIYDNLKKGCWQAYFLSMKYDRNGTLLKLEFFENDSIVKPKRLVFKSLNK